MKLLDSYIGVIAGAAVAAFGFAVASGTEVDPAHQGLVAVLAVLLLASEFFPLPWHPKDGSFTVSWCFAGALLLVAPPVYAMTLIAGASIIGDLQHAKPGRKIGFNAAALALSAAAGGAVVAVTGVRPELYTDASPAPWVLAAIAGMALAVYLTNMVLIAIVLRIQHGASTTAILRESIPHTAMDELLLLGLAPIFVIVGAQSLPLLAIPLLAVTAVHLSAARAAKVRETATRDGLTGLLHRTALIHQIEQREAASVLLLDLRGFRTLNERLGHGAGDEILQMVASRLIATAPEGGIVARYGDDKFAVLVEETLATDLIGLIEQTRAVFDTPFDIRDVPMSLGASVGWAVSTEPPLDGAQLLRQANTSMLADKMASRRISGVVSTEPVDDSLAMLRELKLALAAGELQVAYQPQVDMITGWAVGFEALVRWRRGEVSVPPAEFVLAAEHTDLIWPLTESVLQAALATCAIWWHAGSEVPVAVNVSAASLTDPRLRSTIRSLLIEHDLPGRALEVEITESVLVVDSRGACEALEELATLGVTAAIDDFGTGYASFAHLRDLPVSRLKIDRTFIAEISTDRGHRFVAPIIDLGHNLGLEVVAEGVESLVERDALVALGCDVGQGWHYGRPLTPDAAIRWAASHMPLHLVTE